jgi:hypothetical protein
MLTAYIPYSITLIDGNVHPIQDIFAFRNLFSTLFVGKDFTTRYSIRSGDTPRSIAYYLYTSERYEWIIYCMNAISNPYYEWPLSEDDFYEMVESKYLNKKCLFLDMNSFKNNFVLGEVITTDSGSATGIVDHWDRTLCRLTIINSVGTFQVDDVIKSTSSSGVISRIVDRAEDAVHHFETPKGVKLDPYAGYLQAYLNNSDEVFVITNKQYETIINDSKRSIIVLRPEFAKTAENLLISNINKLAMFEAENLLK